MLIDTHTHLHLEEYDKDRNEVIRRAVDSNVEGIISLGIDYFSSLQTIKIAKKFESVYAAVGIHPSEAHLAKKDEYRKIKTLIEQESKVVAVGEIGLDF